MNRLMDTKKFFAAATAIIIAISLAPLGCSNKADEAKPEQPKTETSAPAAAAAPAAEKEETPAPALEAPKGRVIILGFDGVDPDLVGEMMAAGELPNLSKLKDGGKFQALGSSIPPQSPTAWSSFNTCRNPLNHGIYDFLKRTPNNYMPGVGFGSTTGAKLNADGSLQKAPEYISNRLGDTFWKSASDHGRKVKALLVPFAFPADDLNEECRMLCGLDVPDIRGTQSTYFAIAEAYTETESVGGGIRLPLSLDAEGKATVMIPGLRDPQDRSKEIETALQISVNRENKTITLGVGDAQQLTLPEGEWSAWIGWEFQVSPKYSVKAVSRFHAMNASDSPRLYMTCLQFHPDSPMIRFSSPENYAAELKQRYGLYKTIGWTYDTKALQKDDQIDMTEEMFLEDVAQSMEWKTQLTLDEIDAGNFDLLVSATTGPDRVSHMFWAYRDPKHPLYTEEMAAKYGREVEKTYIKMDETVGRVMAKLKDNDLLMVMSDHGFHSFRRGFNVNKWLIENGYLMPKGKSDPATAYTDEKYLQDYDWSQTKAYGLGLGMIFLNLQGREGQGTVAPADAEALINEIRGKLLALTDPNTGDKVFNDVYININPQGEAVGDAPDIQLGYAEGYQTAKASAAGAAPDYLFEDNKDKWSGEHASSDLASTSGILFANQDLKDGATLVDLGVTALDYINTPVPPEFEGVSLLP